MAVDFVVCAWLCCYSDNDDEDSVQIEIDSTDSIARGAANSESDAQGATNTDSEARGATNTESQARGATNTESEEQTMTLALAEARRYQGPIILVWYLDYIGFLICLLWLLGSKF